MLAVGRELLIGRTVNTNGHWMGGRLAAMGSRLAWISTVDDDLGEISAALKQALGRRPDFIVVVGGLGPTPDDMTLKGVAKGLGRRLARNEDALRMIRSHYVKRGLGSIEMTPARLKMATMPSGSVPVGNPTGTAPGARLEEGRSVVFCLPGVPREMKRMFTVSVEPEVKRVLGELHRARMSLDVEGVYESDMAPLIVEMLGKHKGAYVKSHPKGLKEGRSRILVDIAVVSEDGPEADKEVAEIGREMRRWSESRGATVKSISKPERRAKD